MHANLTICLSRFRLRQARPYAIAALLAGAAFGAFAFQVTQPAFAATATGTLGVSATITAECVVESTDPVAFGSQGVLDEAVTAEGNISVQCTSGQTYSVGLDGGGAGATAVTTRVLTGPDDATINYDLFRDDQHTQNWGNTPATDTVDGTGTGTAVDIPVFGQIGAQTTPAAGAYSDTVNVTVTYN
jgi:spore coat protein U-like protein